MLNSNFDNCFTITSILRMSSLTMLEKLAIVTMVACLAACHFLPVFSYEREDIRYRVCQSGHLMSIKHRELKSWFAAVGKKIKKAPQFVALDKELDAQSECKDQAVRCYCTVGQDGSIQNIRMSCDSPAKKITSLVSALLVDVAPLDVPPNDLPWTNDVKFEFVKTVGQPMEVSVDVFMSNRIGFRD